MFWVNYTYFCREKGKNETALALECGAAKSSGTISNWRNNGAIPRSDKLKLLEDALGITPEQLMSEDAPYENMAENLLRGRNAEQIQDLCNRLDDLTNIITYGQKNELTTVSGSELTEIQIERERRISDLPAELQQQLDAYISFLQSTQGT